MQQQEQTCSSNNCCTRSMAKHTSNRTSLWDKPCVLTVPQKPKGKKREYWVWRTQPHEGERSGHSAGTEEGWDLFVALLASKKEGSQVCLLSVLGCNYLKPRVYIRLLIIPGLSHFPCDSSLGNDLVTLASPRSSPATPGGWLLIHSSQEAIQEQKASYKGCHHGWYVKMNHEP